MKKHVMKAIAIILTFVFVIQMAPMSVIAEWVDSLEFGAAFGNDGDFDGCFHRIFLSWFDT
jgi:hypothetical protein